MIDQAEHLRQIVSRLRHENNKGSKANARVITVTSGKGGVGKTSLTTNLGIYLSQMGYKVVIIDGDFGLANVDLMLGISAKYGLREIISGKMDVEDVIVEGPGGIKFISGGSGIGELINLRPYQMDNFLTKIEKLNSIADIVFVDTGAGATENIIKMALAAHEIILVATPEPTAITDAYALTKLIISHKRDTHLRLVINRAQNRDEADAILNKFTRATESFLNIKVGDLGFVYDDLHVPQSIKRQIPYMVSYPKCQASRQVGNIAKKIVEQEDNNNQGMASYFKRFMGFFSLKDNQGVYQ